MKCLFDNHGTCMRFDELPCVQELTDSGEVFMLFNDCAERLKQMLLSGAITINVVAEAALGGGEG